MEGEESMLLRSLSNGGVSIPATVSSVQDITPATLVSICAQCLNLIEKTESFPSSLPESTVDKFKICTDIALAVKRLGYVGDLTYYKLLYPSEEDLFKLVRFMVERLPDTSTIIHARTKTEESEELEIHYSEETTKDESVYDLAQDLFDYEAENLSSSIEKLKNVLSGNLLNEEDKSRVEKTVLGDEEPSALENDEYAQDISSVGGPLPEPEHQRINEVQDFGVQEEVLHEELKIKTLELKQIEEEFELLQAAANTMFDDQHSVDFYLNQINQQLDSKKHNIAELEGKWDANRKSLDEKKRCLEDSLYADIPSARDKLDKLREVEEEKQLLLSQITKREEENCELSAELESLIKLPSRTSYIERIKEITKNSRKQDFDVERILKDTRELQLESNSIQERLHRTYTVLDEIVFREAKKDRVGRQAYRLLSSIHETFEQISEKILATDRVEREVAEHEKKLAAMASRSLNVDKFQADLDTVMQENKLLEQRLETK